MAELRGVEILQNEIEKSRDRLKGFNENIKKLTGFDNPAPRGRRFGSDSQDYDDNFSGRMGRGRGRLFGMAKRGLMEDSGPPVKRRVVGGAFSRLGPVPVQRRVREESPEEEELPKRLSVHSSVIATSREAKNRQDIMQEQTKDKEGMQRNRRMFGLLLGTLNKFKTDSKTLESKAEQRKRIDQKLEENAEKEKKKFKQETQQLMEERHLEQTRISRLEQKMEFVQEHADREKEIKKLKNFLCTKTKPRIFWKPRQMNTAAENKLKDSVKIVDEMLHKSQVRLEKEIKEVMERENKREERIKMRLREDGLFLDDEENKGKGDNEKGKNGSDVEGTELGEKDGDVSLQGNVRLNDEINEIMTIKKMKNKRRVVVEEERKDTSSEGEVSCEEEEEREEKKNRTLKKNDGESLQKVERQDNEDSSENSNSDSSESEDQLDHKQKKRSEGTHDKKNTKVKSKNDNDKTDDDDNENHDKSSRVVLYRETSRDKIKSRKENKKGGSDSERHEHKSHRDKHGHRHSKHSRRDNEKVVIKEERDDRHEKKKSKSSERTVVVADEEKTTDRKRNTMNLIGEEDDVEMESENNVTM